MKSDTKKLMLRTVLISLVVAAMLAATMLFVGCKDMVFTETEMHTLSPVEQLDPTCTEAGVRVYYTCSLCSNIYSDENAKNEILDFDEWKAEGGKGYLAPTGHDFYPINSGIPATCLADGLQSNKRCNNCQLVVKGEVIPATGHNFEYIGGYEPTCAEPGLTKTARCINCEHTIVGEPIPATGKHTFGDNYRCTVCNAIDNDAIAVEIKNNGYLKFDDDSVFFGMYPTTLVTDQDTIQNLGTFSEYTWSPYEYSQKNKSNFMYYIDKKIQNKSYRGVYIKSYRLENYDAQDNAENSWQDDNGYMAGNTYWFEYTPIRWTILSEANGTMTLVSDTVLDNQELAIKPIDNYQLAKIRNWFANQFIGTAFSEFQKSLLVPTAIDNSTESVWLMSSKEFAQTSKAKKGSTDYAKAQGLHDYEGYSAWWLRDYNTLRGGFNYVGANSIIYYEAPTKNLGIVPVLKLCLGHEYADNNRCHDVACVHCGYVVKATEKHTFNSDISCCERVCAVCGDTILATTEHTFENNFTCTDRTCTKCGSLVEKTTEHKFGVVFACQENHCEVCGFTVAASIEHQLPEKELPCKGQYCEICDTFIQPTQEHSFMDEFTCHSRTCLVCGTTAMPTSQHNLADSFECHDRTCLNCGTVVKATKSHSFDDLDPSHDRTCLLCGEFVPAKVKAKVHMKMLRLAVDNTVAWSNADECISVNLYKYNHFKTLVFNYKLKIGDKKKN